MLKKIKLTVLRIVFLPVKEKVLTVVYSCMFFPTITMSHSLFIQSGRYQVHEGKMYQGEGFWDATYSGFSTEAEDMYFPRTPVSDGRFTVPIDESGRWFVRFFTKVDSPEENKSEYYTEERTTTVTFEVRNERKRPKNDSH